MILNIFTKALIISILESKVKSKEISGYRLTDTKLHLMRQKHRSKVIYNLNLSNLSAGELAKILYREIPKDMDNHFKIEIRNIKIRKVIDG